jgi:hypothetical protein
MAHILVGLVIFLVCLWAVFSHRVHDGFIGRHLLVFAAIAGAGFAYSGEVRAFLTAYTLILIFSILFMVQNLRKMSHAKMD